MKKTLLTSGLCALFGLTTYAQVVSPSNSKWDAQVERLLLNQKQTRSASSEAQNLMITASDPYAVAEALQAMGLQADVVSNSLLTTSLPVHQIAQVAAMDDVEYIQVPRTFQPLVNTAREAIGVDDIHNSVELETPFTGKDVIVAVIDQSFEPRHIAFLKNKLTRVIGYWSRQQNKMITPPATGGDGLTASSGHATHVAAIAAGSKVDGCDYYGMAPEADLVFVPSTFGEDEILRATKAIHDLAKSEGKPYVINMSFGSQLGPHDGTSTYDQNMSKYSIDGGILVAAMGNEGGMTLHASHTFTQADEVKYVVFDVPTGNTAYNVIDVWGTNANGQQNLKVRPFVFNSITKKKDFKTTAFWTTCATVNASLDKMNNKEHYYYQVATDVLQSGDAKLRFGLEITGDSADGFHLWVNPSYGEVSATNYGSTYVKGDNDYCVGEGAASIPRTVAVASFNSNNGRFISAQDNKEYSWGGTTVGDISSFSSVGPWLGDDNKPTIAAPGSVISSAYNQYDGDFDASNVAITQIVKSGTKKYYYGIMSGTSMATPAVTGVIALWLEANPELNYEKVVEIFKETAIRDKYTGTKNDWDEEFGYGKIDAYAGLKKALELAEASGINEMHNSVAPVSLQKGGNAWRILFNNDESYANITLYNMSGKTISTQHLNDIRRGNETVVSLANLPAGAYLLRINTTLGTLTRKVLVD